MWKTLEFKRKVLSGILYVVEQCFSKFFRPLNNFLKKLTDHQAFTSHHPQTVILSLRLYSLLFAFVGRHDALCNFCFVSVGWLNLETSTGPWRAASVWWSARVELCVSSPGTRLQSCPTSWCWSWQRSWTLNCGKRWWSRHYVLLLLCYGALIQCISFVPFSLQKMS